jgi:T-complex protein 1 subunit eta
LAGDFLKQCKPFIEEGVHPQVIVKAFRRATHLVSCSLGCPLQ